jgi:hypothetical protein
MTPYDREIEKYINDTYPLPQWESIARELPTSLLVNLSTNIDLSIG